MAILHPCNFPHCGHKTYIPLITLQKLTDLRYEIWPYPQHPLYFSLSDFYSFKHLDTFGRQKNKKKKTFGSKREIKNCI